jgi:hypothetical protein
MIKGIHIQMCRKSRLTTEELLEAVFSLQPDSKLSIKDNSLPKSWGRDTQTAR